jgi:hypothetical protein
MYGSSNFDDKEMMVSTEFFGPGADMGPGPEVEHKWSEPKNPIMDTDDMDIPDDIKARIRGDHDDRYWFQRDIDEFKNLGKRVAAMVNSVFRMEGKSEVEDDMGES